MLEKVNDGVVSAHAKDENALMLTVGGDYSVGVRCYFLAAIRCLPRFQVAHHLPFQSIVLIAIRDIDPDEWVNLNKHNVKCFTVDHVIDLGVGEVMLQAIAYLDPKGIKISTYRLT